MFGGNAKTHFQVIGRSESTGYMMSPFGDERWDVDDNEKLCKVLKKKNISNLTYTNNNNNSNNNNNNNNNYETVKYGYQQQQQQNYQANQQQYKEQSRHSYYPTGYIHQSGTAQGYMPKTEVAHNYSTGQEAPQQHYYQTQTNYPVQAHRSPSNVDSHYTYATNAANYRTTAVKHYNGLNQEDIRKRSRCIYSQPLKYESQSLSKIPSLCERCQQANQRSQEYGMTKNWKTSPNVPVLIAGEMGYQPFGPEATPNPFYPNREGTMYMPLR